MPQALNVPTPEHFDFDDLTAVLRKLGLYEDGCDLTTVEISPRNVTATYLEKVDNGYREVSYRIPITRKDNQ